MADYDAKALIGQVRDLMRRPDRHHRRAMVASWVGVLAIALLPLGAPLLATALLRDTASAGATAADAGPTAAEAAAAAGEPDAAAGEPAETPLDRARTRARERLDAALDRFAAAPPPAAETVAAARIAARRIAEIATRREAEGAAAAARAEADTAKAAAAATRARVAVQTAFRTQALFAAGLALLTALALALLLAQYQLVSRHWVAFWPRADQRRLAAAATQAPTAAATALGLATATGLVWATLHFGWSAWVYALPLLLLLDLARRALAGLGGGGLLVLRLPGLVVLATLGVAFVASLGAALSLDLPGSLGAAAADLGATGLTLPAAILAALVLGVVGITAFGTLMYAGNFPKAQDVEAFFAQGATRLDPDTAAAEAGAIWKAMKKTLKAGYDELGLPSDALPSPEQKDAFRAAYPPIPVNSGLPADRTMAVIRVLTLPVAVLLVVALVVLTLGFDVLEARLGTADTALAAAIDRATEAWVLMLGAGFTLSLGLLYAIPMARVAPFQAARAALDAGAAPPEREIWAGRLFRQIAGGARGFDFTLEQGRKADLEKDRENAAKAAAEKTRDAPDPAGAPPTAPPNDPPTDPPTDPDEIKRRIDAFLDGVLADHLGASGTKFAAILEGASYGAGLHGVLQEPLTTQIKPILALLAPALAGGLLTVFG